mmetsp:Transcript_20285/g.17511  ORF Transcript_20285/g.17511 Transcript_20285/m.17511 type:complete len:103 (-) Transcript_20285:1230-1538(-)
MYGNLLGQDGAEYEKKISLLLKDLDDWKDRYSTLEAAQLKGDQSGIIAELKKLEEENARAKGDNNILQNENQNLKDKIDQIWGLNQQNEDLIDKLQRENRRL